jgi:hypothetical protein
VTQLHVQRIHLSEFCLYSEDVPLARLGPLLD